MTFAARLKQARAATGKTQRFIAEAMGVSVQAVSQWEKGQVTIQPERVAKLASILDVNSSWLIQGHAPHGNVVNLPEKISNKPLYGNRPASVVKLRDIHQALKGFDPDAGSTRDFDGSFIEEVIFIREDQYIDPMPVRIEVDALAPDLLSGDIAIFDNGRIAHPGDIIAIMISFSGLFQVSQLKENVASLRPAIVRFTAEAGDLHNQILMDVDDLEFDRNQKPAIIVLGPLVERRTFTRKSSEGA